MTSVTGITGGVERPALGPVTPDEDVFHDSSDDTDYVALLEESVRQIEEDDIVDAEVLEPEGWDIPPPGVRVVRNRDKNGPRWIRKA